MAKAGRPKLQFKRMEWRTKIPEDLWRLAQKAAAKRKLTIQQATVAALKAWLMASRRAK